MLRFYVCQVIGTGSSGDPFRPAITDVIETNGFEIGWGGDDGRVDETSATGWMIVWTDVTDLQHNTIAADSRITWIPFENSLGEVLGPGDRIGDLDPNRRTQIRTVLENHHVPIDDLTLQDTLRTVIGRIIRRIRIRRALQKRISGVLENRDFSEALNTLISDIPITRRQNINQWLTERGYDTSVVQGTDTVREALQKLTKQQNRVNRNYWR